jgi:hypothetical protein
MEGDRGAWLVLSEPDEAGAVGSFTADLLAPEATRIVDVRNVSGSWRTRRIPAGRTLSRAFKRRAG